MTSEIQDGGRGFLAFGSVVHACCSQIQNFLSHTKRGRGKPELLDIVPRKNRWEMLAPFVSI